MTATDLEERLSYLLPAECADGESGKFLFPFQELKDLKSALKGKNQAVLEAAGDESVSVTTGIGDQPLVRTVASMPADEFPEAGPDISLHKADVGEFIRTYRHVAFSASTRDDRRTLTGIYADPERKSLVATDGKRLSASTVESFPFDTDAVLPNTKVLNSILPDKGEGMIGLLSEQQGTDFACRIGDWDLRCKCIEGRYPNYEQVIPDKEASYRGTITVAEADAETLENAVSQFRLDAENSLFLYAENNTVATGATDNDHNTMSVVSLPNSTIRDSTDGGTWARVFGTFLSWMQEKTCPVFVAATANDVSQLPPELLRRGRFDELFFVDLPEEAERKAIWRIHLGKRERQPDDFDLETLARHSQGFTGSEIEQAVIDAMFSAYDSDGELDTDKLLQAISDTVPLSVTMAEKVKELRKWAKQRARPAGVCENAESDGAWKLMV